MSRQQIHFSLKAMVARSPKLLVLEALQVEQIFGHYYLEELVDLCKQCLKKDDFSHIARVSTCRCTR
jgi:hypothetical protein